MIYHNEIEPFARKWIRELMREGAIPAGEIDGRDIYDVCTADVIDYAQVHLFSGIAGWSYALDLAGWPARKEVWTCSCPCQPFSQAGKGAGFDDERHLWPAAFWLIEQCRPATIFGEQVASPLGRVWLDLVRSDLEGIGYAFGACVLPSAGVAAPCERHRLWWVGRYQGGRCGEHGFFGGALGERQNTGQPAQPDKIARAMANTYGRDACAEREQPSGEQRFISQNSSVSSLASSSSRGLQAPERPHLCGTGRWREGREAERFRQPSGFWGRAEWLLCRDGKYRPVEPGIYPLAPRLPWHVGALRGAGNSINPHVAAEFIKACMT